VNRPLRNLDLGSSTTISTPWFVEISPAPINAANVQMYIPDRSLTRSAEDVAAVATERGVLTLGVVDARLSTDEQAAFSFIRPKAERRLHVVTRNLGRGVVIVDD